MYISGMFEFVDDLGALTVTELPVATNAKRYMIPQTKDEINRHLNYPNLMPISIIVDIVEQMEHLNDNYGADRDFFNSDGGYILIVPTKEDAEEFLHLGSIEESCEEKIVYDDHTAYPVLMNNETIVHVIVLDYLRKRR